MDFSSLINTKTKHINSMSFIDTNLVAFYFHSEFPNSKVKKNIKSKNEKPIC